MKRSEGRNGLYDGGSGGWYLAIMSAGVGCFSQLALSHLDAFECFWYHQTLLGNAL